MNWIKKSALLLVAGFLFSTHSYAEVQTEKKEEKSTEVKKGQPSQEEMMTMMAKFSTPGEAHKHLKNFVGKFNVVTKFWMEPGAPPKEDKGKSEGKFILGDRFVQEEFTSTFLNMPFEGIGITGYDNYKKKYVGMWIDSMGTCITPTEGTMDSLNKVLTQTMEMLDPVTGITKKARMITKIESDKKHVAEMYETGADGKEMKTMEITYTRE